MKIILAVILSTITIYSQTFKVSGKVIEEKSNSPLQYANVRILNTTQGTSTNKDGIFELHLEKGEYKLITSFIGYYSDTSLVIVKGEINNLKIVLTESFVNLQEVVVIPGENPALEIIRRAIEQKKKREKKISSYSFSAYTKGVIKTSEELQAGSASISLGVSVEDTLKITGLLENISEGYFKKPNKYKEIITARKQSSNFPSTINTLTGGRFVQNFYSDDVSFFGQKLVSPLADNSLKYYFFYIDDTLSINNINVFKIKMMPDDSLDPGFIGDIYISSDNYHLLKIDLSLNKAANIGGLFEKVNVFQQFFPYGDNVYMPVDYRLDVEVNYLNLVKAGFEIHTVLSKYNLEANLNDKFFDKAVLTVLTDADKKDSTFWTQHQAISNTMEEIEAYKRIDSLSLIKLTFWDKFSFFSSSIELFDNVSVSGPLSLYHFNKVEGHALDFSIRASNLFDERLWLNSDVHYGFSDKKSKKSIGLRLLLGDYRTTTISFSLLDNIEVLYKDASDYGELFTTLNSLISKYDPGDYYYQKGIQFGLSGEVFSFLFLRGGYSYTQEKSAINNSDFSFFAKSKSYSSNRQITDGNYSRISCGFTLDFRNYIEDGKYRRRIGESKFNVIIDGGYEYYYGTNSFSIIRSSIRTFIPTYRNSSLNIRLRGFYSLNNLPVQYLNVLPGNFELLSRNYSFRTLAVNSVFAERAVTLFIEHNLRKELFNLFGIGFLQEIDLQFSYFLNGALTNLSSSDIFSAQINSLKFTKPFFETGFSLSHPLFPIVLEFAWKLNHFDNNNFKIGLTSIIF